MTDAPNGVRIAPAGDAALVVELGDEIARALNERVRRLEAAIAAAAWPEVTATVPTYRSLLVYYDPSRSSYAELESKIRALGEAPQTAPAARRRWTIPVSYGGELGFDLETMARKIGMASERVVELHSSVEYMVYMIGFLPGYAYLGELPPEIAIPRKAVPLAEVPPGTVQIGGQQTGIGPLKMPCGWYIIGQTPAVLFDQKRARPFLLEAGDQVRFVRISPDEYRGLVTAAARGEFEPEWVPHP